jgi:excisionase family DNA binding protein
MSEAHKYGGKALLKRPEAAERVNVGVRTLDRLVKLRQIPFIKLGTRLIRFCPDMLDTWVRNKHNDNPANN